MLDSGAFVVGKAAADGDDRVIYDQGRGEILYDADGVGGAEAVRLATVDGGTSITAEDFFVV